MAEALVIADFRNALPPGGALAVPHGDAVAERLNTLAASGDHNLAVAARDRHAADHGSFRIDATPGDVHRALDEVRAAGGEVR